MTEEAKAPLWTPLNQRADMIESGKVRWVPTTPGPGECCLGWNGDPGEHDDIQQGLPFWALPGIQGEAVCMAITGKPLACGDPFTVIKDWNDAKGRTKEEVVALLRQAAQSLCEQP